MAKQVNVTLTDDLDGETPADTTIEFTLDGIDYEIDLCYANAQKMRSELDTWVNHARKIRGNSRPRRIGTGPKEDLAPIREWAHANGIKVSSRGRISSEVIKAFWERDKTKTGTTTVASKAKARRVAAALDKVEENVSTVEPPKFSEA